MTEPFDIKRAREETAACDEIIHFNLKIGSSTAQANMH